MDATEFWCRAFLVEMKKHGGDLERCQEIADAALWRAQQRGMVTGERAAPRKESELERVKFRAEHVAMGQWDLDIPDVGGVVSVPVQCASMSFNGQTFHIKWTETMPPKPAEVWIERPKGGA